MPVIIGVKFRSNSKSYYFDPCDVEFKQDDGVIVETSRGVEFGKVVIPNKEVGLKEGGPELKKIIRKATDKDIEQLAKIEGLNKQAYNQALPKIAELNPDMKLVSAEYTFDMSKIVFYFTCEGRVDFRDLVRALAAIFKRRIEMRQIDEREDFRMRGCLAPCGRECCCAAGVTDCDKITIKMAKVQGLPLNPTKISGMCGKLMCCLKYESEYYTETSKIMPKKGSEVETPDGKGKVEEIDMLRRQVRVKIVRNDGEEYKKFGIDEIKFEKKAVAEEKDANDDSSEIPQE